MSPYAVALLAGLGVLFLSAAEVYRLLGAEWIEAMFERLVGGDKNDDDPRGIGGGYA